MSIINVTNQQVDVTDDWLSHFTPNLAINERKDGEDTITYEDVVTPTEHTYTTIERVQTGTKTVFDSSSETFGWSNIQYKNYEIVDEPNTNNGRKMYVAHFTAQLSDGTTHDLEYRLTFNPNFVNRYYLSGGNLWLHAKTNYVLTIYVEIFDRTDNKMIEGDVDVTMKDLDNAKGNFSGAWEGVSLASDSIFVSTNYGAPKTTSWHNQTWYSGYQDAGTTGGNITLKVKLRDHFAHAFDYVLVNGDGYGASFGVQDLNLATMTKVTTTSHEVPVYEDREVTHTETIDIHSTVEHVTPAPIIKSVNCYLQTTPLKIYLWDCDNCRFESHETIEFSRNGWLMNDNTVNWGKFVSSDTRPFPLKNELQLVEENGILKLKDFIVDKPYLFSHAVWPNTDTYTKGTIPYSNVTNMTMQSHINDGVHYIFTYTFNADYQGTQHDLNLIVRVPENLIAVQPDVVGLDVKIGWQRDKNVTYEMQIFDKTLNANVTGDVEFNVSDVDNQNGNFSNVWEGIKPTSNTRFIRSTRPVRIKSGYFSTDRATTAEEGNAGTLTFKTKLNANGFTPIYVYRLISPLGSQWYTEFSPNDIKLDNIRNDVEINKDDAIELYFYKCCKPCGYKDPKVDNYHMLEDYLKECYEVVSWKNRCHWESKVIYEPVQGCGKECKPCWEKRVIEKYKVNECYNMRQKDWPCQVNKANYYNKQQLLDRLDKWYKDNENTIKGLFTAIVMDLNDIKTNFDNKQRITNNLDNFAHASIEEIEKLKGIM